LLWYETFSVGSNDPSIAELGVQQILANHPELLPSCMDYLTNCLHNEPVAQTF